MRIPECPGIREAGEIPLNKRNKDIRGKSGTGLVGRIGLGPKSGDSGVPGADFFVFCRPLVIHQC